MIRPLHDYIIVDLDPVPEKKGLVVIVGDEERVRTGKVMRAGPGRWLTEANRRAPLGVEVGEKVAFFRENFDTIQGKAVARIVAEVEPGTVMIRARDLLYAFAEVP